jgi:hypothetical protein
MLIDIKKHSTKQVFAGILAETTTSGQLDIKT